MAGILPKLILGVTLLLLASGAPIPDEPQSETAEEHSSGTNRLDSGSPSPDLLEPPGSNTAEFPAEEGAPVDIPSGESSSSDNSDSSDTSDGSSQEVPAENQGPATPDKAPSGEPEVPSEIPVEVTNESAGVTPEESAGAPPLPAEESLPQLPQAADGAAVPAGVTPEESAGAPPLPAEESLPQLPQAADGAAVPAGVIPQESAGALPLPAEESLPPVPQAADGAVVPEEAPVVPAVAPGAGAPDLTVPRVFPLENPSGAQPFLPGHKLVHEQKTEGSQQDSFSEAEQAAAQASGASASGNAVKNVHGYSNEGGFRKTDGFSEQSENRYGSGNFQGSEGFDQTSSGHQGSFAVKSYGVHGNPSYADALKVGFVP
uniref:Putative nad+--protein-arginine adp-ribosyltransferase n=1 Tax=Ixodes ricinus TaxID=34613 RepID=A0A6B0V950_IXORI